MIIDGECAVQCLNVNRISLTKRALRTVRPACLWSG